MPWIRFKRLVAENALTWERLEVDLSEQGLVLIQGKNGTGKSNILELLSALIYNKTTKSGQNNDLVNRLRNKNFRILLELSKEEEDGWVDYDILCCRKCRGEPTGIRIWRNGAEEPITPVKNPVQAQKMVAELIGMSFDEFQAVVSLGAETTHPLISGTDTTRSEYIARTFGIEYDEYFDAVTLRLKRINLALAQRDDNVSQLKAWRDQLAAVGNDPQSMGRTFKSLKSRVEESDARLEDLKKKDRALFRKMSGQKQRQELTGNADRQKLRPSDDIDADIRSTKKKIRDIESILDEWDERERLQKDRKRLLDKHKRKISFDSKALVVAETRLVHLESKLDLHAKLTGKTDCPTCGQDVSKLAMTEEEFQALEDSVFRQEKAIRRMKQQEEKYKERQADYQRASSILDEIQSIKPKVGQDKAVKALRRLQAKLDKLEDEYTMASRQEAIVEELNSLPSGDWKKTQRLMQKVEKSQSAESAKNRELHKKKTLMAQALRDYHRISSTIDELERSIQDTEGMAEEKRLLEGLVAAFGKNGLKRDRVRDILKLIADHLHHYTRSLLPRYEFQLVDNEKKTAFIAVNRDDGTFGDVRSLSKGEKKRLSISLLLTERDIRRVKTNILFLDEFDGGVDEEGTPELIEILAELKTDYESIFAITHNVEIKKFEGFDREYEVSRNKTFSSIKRIKRRR